MHTRTKKILMAGALLAVAAAAPGARAADQNAFFEQQRQDANGFNPDLAVPQQAPVLAIPAPVPRPPVNAVATIPSPSTSSVISENAWLAQQRNATDGSVSPMPLTSSRTDSLFGRVDPAF